MHYAKIKYRTIENGEGIRISLFVSGCNLRCKGCHNAQVWDFSYGNEFTEETEKEIINFAKDNSYISGLTILGGEPFDPRNQEALASFAKRFKTETNKSVWCYTGYVLEKDLLADNGRAHTQYTKDFLNSIDILIDGPFDIDQRDLTLPFRGSRNQRILKLKDLHLEK